MLVDIEGKEIQIGDICICTLNTREYYKITIIRFTNNGVHYKTNSKHNNREWTSYIHKSSAAAQGMYKV